MLLAALLAALFLLPRTAFALLIALLLAVAAAEWARLCAFGRHAWAYAAAVALAFLACLYTGAERLTFVVAALFWLVVAPLWMWCGVRAAHRASLAAAGFAVLVPAGLALVALEPLEALAALVLVWIADTAAYFVGRAWGRRKLAPAISPGKTWEGAAGGLLGVGLYAIMCGFFIPGIAWLPFLAAAALLAIASIVGDLFESAAKRQAGVKDSGSVLPGHGGVLDRIDSAAATLPLAGLLWPLIKASP